VAEAAIHMQRAAPAQVLVHDPDAAVYVLSPTLAGDAFGEYRAAGYAVHVLRVSPEVRLRGDAWAINALFGGLRRSS
jgi:hypothetical protein